MLNTKPWATKDVKMTINKKKVAFASKDEDKFKAAWRDLKRSSRLRKSEYKLIMEVNLLCYNKTADQLCDVIHDIFSLSLSESRIPKMYKSSVI